MHKAKPGSKLSSCLQLAEVTSAEAVPLGGFILC